LIYRLLRPLLFRLDAEQAHHLSLTLLRWAGATPPIRTLLRQIFTLDADQLAVEAFGLRFKNPVGLAAGYDKNASAVLGLSTLGFGHLELGTVTRRPQVGNPKPRVHRVPEAEAILNSMGFPNAGAAAVQVPRVPGVRIGLNLGKGRDTPVDRAAEDYCLLLEQLYRQADYVAINISSPNTLNLRQLQARAAITELLTAVTAVRNRLTPRVPLLVKIAPDLTEAELDDVLDAVGQTGIDGIIATNTTVSRAGIPAAYTTLPGGLSGAPLRNRATEIVRYLARRSEGRLPIIGVGGILSADDALERLEAGAWLIQLYTGLIYRGPGLVSEILAALSARAKT
jgi:dihydroorotate dehydrogenase